MTRDQKVSRSALHVLLGTERHPGAFALPIAQAAAGDRVQLLVSVELGAPPEGAPMTMQVVSTAGMPRPGDDLVRACQQTLVATAEAQQLDRGVIDLVVAHGWVSVAAAGRVAARHGAPLVVVVRDGLRSGLESPAISEERLAELAAWGAPRARRVLVGSESARMALVRLAGVEPERVEVLPDVRDMARTIVEGRRSDAVEFTTPARTFDVGVLGDGAPWQVVEALLARWPAVLVVKGSSPEERAAACLRCRVLVMFGGDVAKVASDVALSNGALPIVVEDDASKHGRAVGTTLRELPATILRWLGDESGRARRITSSRPAATATALPIAAARPIRVVLNHGGVVARELSQSLAEFGWEVRPLLGESRDPLPFADLLIALPYGDPRGALETIRRARRLCVPTAFWNVEDPRYFLDPEVGPLVQAAAREASATFSTTTQLAADYGSLGVDVEYLPNYGRSFFLRAEPVDEARRTIDLLFLGTITPERRRVLDLLRQGLGSSVTLVARDDVHDPDEQRELVASARLGLSFGTLTDARGGTRWVRGEGVTERAFDYPLAWTPVLHDARAHLADSFALGEEVVVFEDPAAAVSLARELLDDPERRLTIARRARERVLRRDLGRHRVLSIVETLIARGHVTTPSVRAAAEAARSRVDASGGPS